MSYSPYIAGPFPPRKPRPPFAYSAPRRRSTSQALPTTRSGFDKPTSRSTVPAISYNTKAMSNRFFNDIKLATLRKTMNSPYKIEMSSVRNKAIESTERKIRTRDTARQTAINRVRAQEQQAITQSFDHDHAVAALDFGNTLNLVPEPHRLTRNARF